MFAKIGNTDWNLIEVRRNSSGSCDHCGRSLKHVYVVENEITGKRMTVGITHCKAVTGWTLSVAEAQRILWYAETTVKRNAAWQHFTEIFPDVAQHIATNPKGYFWKGEIVDAPEFVRANFAADYRRRIMI